MKKYVFNSNNDARRFVFEVIAVSNIWNFDFRFNYVKIFDNIPEEIERQVKLYGGKEESTTK